MKDFINILKKIQILYVLDIYPAGEKAIKNINSFNLVKELKKHNQNSFYLNKKADLEVIIKNYTDDENTIIFMGAGSVTHMANKLFDQ